TSYWDRDGGVCLLGRDCGGNRRFAWDLGELGFRYLLLQNRGVILLRTRRGDSRCCDCCDGCGRGNRLLGHFSPLRARNAPSGNLIQKAISQGMLRTYRFRVRHDELDSFGHLNNALCVKYMQEAAIRASTDAGYTLQWYDERGAAWVIRRLEIRYYLQVRYGDQLEVTTWISECGRSTCTREYN